MAETQIVLFFARGDRTASARMLKSLGKLSQASHIRTDCELFFIWLKMGIQGFTVALFGTKNVHQFNLNTFPSVVFVQDLPQKPQKP